MQMDQFHVWKLCLETLGMQAHLSVQQFLIKNVHFTELDLQRESWSQQGSHVLQHHSGCWQDNGISCYMSNTTHCTFLSVISMAPFSALTITLWYWLEYWQVQALSFINLCYSQYLTTSYANSCCMPLPWWSLLQSHFWLGVLHCRLSQTSISFRNHTKLVSQVSCQL